MVFNYSRKKLVGGFRGVHWGARLTLQLIFLPLHEYLFLLFLSASSGWYVRFISEILHQVFPAVWVEHLIERARKSNLGSSKIYLSFDPLVIIKIIKIDKSDFFLISLMKDTSVD